METNTILTKPLLTIFLLFTGLFCYAQSYETVSYNLNGTPANGMKIKTNLPYTNSTQMVNVKIEGYCYGTAAAVGLNIVYYIYNDAFVNNSVSSWGAYTPDIYLSNESGLVCITLADKPYFPRFKVSAFAKGMPAETAANFTGWTVVDEAAAGTNITLFPYKNVVKNLTINGTATAPTADPTTNNTQLATTAFVKAAITGIGGGYIQNSSVLQSSSNFNISGSGIMGRLGLSAVPASNIAIENATSLSGGASSYGFLNRGIVQSDVTSVAAYNRTTAQTAAASFTLSNIIHNYATQGTFGAGSTVNNQIGFWADATLVGGTNNYGFYGGIPSGANRYNLYMASTANNFLAGNTTIGLNDQGGQLSVRPATDATKGIVAKGFSATQTGNLFEAQTSAAVQVFQISSTGSGTFAGSLAIGSQNTGVNFNNIKDLTGGTAAYGTVNQGVVQSDVTALASYNRTTARTAAGSFTVNQIIHNWATQGTFGAGSTVTSQFGFYAEANLVGADNNYGFYGNIPSGGGRFNLFMNGTAQNYLKGPTSIGTGSALSAQLATVPASDAIKGIVVKAFSPTQASNLLEAQNSAGTVISGISNGGSIFSTNTVYAPALANTVSSNNAMVSVNATGTVISRSIADAVDVLSVVNSNATSTGNIQNWKFGSVSRMSLSAAGNLTLSTTPATSAGAYNILTHNSTTGVVEKIASSALDVPWTGVTGKPTTLVGYGITDAYSSTNFRALSAPNSAGGTDANTFLNGHTASYYSSSWLSNGYFTGTAGYGGLISFPYSTSTTGNLQLNYSWGHSTTTGGGIAFRTQKNDGSFTTWKELYHSGNLNNLNQLGTRNFSDLQSKPTTLTGYGITDGATSASVTAVQASLTTLDGNAVHKAGTETITGTKFLNGGVGISLSDPGKLGSYKLAVGGAVIAESMKVKPQTEWPDFVFEKDYPMLSLGDLEKFIIKNKHLPDVPSAAAVKKEGLDLGEMNAKLLQKIEELTLYLIEKDKEIKKLSEKDKEIKLLSERVKELSEDIKMIKNKLNP
ncbi:MAG TPA: hypothetical protein VK541_10540 [Pedobacter sp.]|uniref:beta strand repeat-containing protein n=1 Tax=Pedobacter sp. TaxID=1411316 RepID=UPI002C929E97|nr:hypothetical protein [Pedobacter sp.]HMI02911.1 hypothetical protein [Pedobacter sp.]